MCLIFNRALPSVLPRVEVQKGGVEHADLWGTHAKPKYSWLEEHNLGNSGFIKLKPDSPYYFFKKQNTDCRAEYETGWKIKRGYATQLRGLHYRTRPFRGGRRQKMHCLHASVISPISKQSDAEIRANYFAGCGSDKYPDGDTRGWKVPEARRRVATDKKMEGTRSRL